VDREQKPLLLTQGEALALLGGIGRTKLWDLVNHGEIVRVNVGRRAGRRCGRRARGHGVPPRSSSRAGRGGFASPGPLRPRRRSHAASLTRVHGAFRGAASHAAWVRIARWLLFVLTRASASRGFAPGKPTG